MLPLAFILTITAYIIGDIPISNWTIPIVLFVCLHRDWLSVRNIPRLSPMCRRTEYTYALGKLVNSDREVNISSRPPRREIACVDSGPPLLTTVLASWYTSRGCRSRGSSGAKDPKRFWGGGESVNKQHVRRRVGDAYEMVLTDVAIGVITKCTTVSK